MSLAAASTLLTAQGPDVPPLTLLRVFSSWTFDPAVLIPMAVAAGLYGWGVRVLHRRGDE